MKCSRCKQPVLDHQWFTRSAEFVRHIQCPKKNSRAAERRAKQRARWRASLRSN